jgi:hypothetical protein
MVAGVEHCQLRAAIEVLVPYRHPSGTSVAILGVQNAESRACTLQPDSLDPTAIDDQQRPGLRASLPVVVSARSRTV